MIFHALSHTEYTDLCYSLLSNFEKKMPQAYLDSKGIPSIGVGFNLSDKNILKAVLTNFGVDTSETTVQAFSDIVDPMKHRYSTNSQLQNALNAAMSGLNANRSTFEFHGEAEMRKVFDAVIGTYNDRVNNWYATRDGIVPNRVVTTIPESTERAVLVSLSYNGLLASSVSLRHAIESGSRAGAWYEIRYNSNRLGNLVVEALRQTDHMPLQDALASIVTNSKDRRGINTGEDCGVAKRRYLESELFGLYDTPGTITAEESRNMQGLLDRMFILTEYEMVYGQINPVLASKDGSRCDCIAAAMRDYHVNNAPPVLSLATAFYPLSSSGGPVMGIGPIFLKAA